jgi:tripartite ATP-independent transporter DctM subunit
MSPAALTGILFGSMLLLVASGLPIAFALGGLAVLFTLILWGSSGFYSVVLNTFGVMTNYLLVAIPMFVFMSVMLEKGGIAEDLFSAVRKWMGGIRGGLAVGTVVIAVILAAMMGISAAATAVLGLIALPTMLRFGYKKEISVGSIQAGAALAMLIPPSALMIILGLFGTMSPGQLFIAGILPGVVLASLFIAYILIRSWLQPDLGPGLPREERATLKEKFISLRSLVLPIMLIALVLGSIFFGVTTVTEASGMGAFGSIIVAAVYRRLNWNMLREVCLQTLRVSAMIMWIVFAATAFTAVYNGIGGPGFIGDLMTGIPGGRWVTLIVMQVIILLLGCFLDSGAIALITIPIFLPIAESLGFNPIWFGILFVMNCEMGLLTPPFGINLFVMRSVAPATVTTGDIYRSIIPFVGLQALGLALVMIFPQIALWLPGVMLK